MLVNAIRDETENIKTFELVDPQSSELQTFSAGSHIEIELPGKRFQCLDVITGTAGCPWCQGPAAQCLA